MSDWDDADGNPLGRWEPCSEAEYEELSAVLAEDASVFASHTDVGRSLHPSGYGSPHADRDLYTEWGRRGENAPLIACHDRWDSWGKQDHRHYRFVAAGVGGLSAEGGQTK